METSELCMNNNYFGRLRWSRHFLARRWFSFTRYNVMYICFSFHFDFYINYLLYIFFGSLHSYKRLFEFVSSQNKQSVVSLRECIMVPLSQPNVMLNNSSNSVYEVLIWILYYLITICSKKFKLMHGILH